MACHRHEGADILRAEGRTTDMDIIERNEFVLMRRDNLDGVLDFRLPTEFAAKWYEPG